MVTNQCLASKGFLAPCLAWIFPLLGLLEAALWPWSAEAQITPGGLGSRVNGSAFGSCSAGRCAINGGVKTGKNLFHRFASFDTRHGITEVRLDSRGQENVILGVVGPQGALLNTPLRLTSAANLFLLSPNGVWIGSGASFINVPNLLLSTSFALTIGRDRFDLFAASPSAVQPLSGSPALRWGEEDADAGLAFAGEGSMVFEGGLISVDRHLLIDAGSGLIRSTAAAATTLRAGDSLRLRGGALELEAISLAAGHGPQLGTLQLNAGDGPARLDGAQLLARRIAIDGGRIAVSHSQLRAPDGSIQMQASQPSAAESQLELSNSQLDVAWNDAFTANDQAGFEQPPSIALATEGSLTISRSRLNTFTDAPSADRSPPIKSRSGVIVVKAKSALAVESSTVVADGANSPAGEIVMVVDGADGGGGLWIDHSRLSASHGMGGGRITLASSSGLALNSSALVASSNRFPVIHGQPFGVLKDGGEAQLRPFAFQGGRISLSNTSTTAPLTLHNSQLLAPQSTEGGGLQSPELRHSPGDADGYWGKEIAFTLGYQPDFSGGGIVITSKGGITAGNHTLIDASSKPDNGQGLENIAGFVTLANIGERPIRIHDSAVMATSGPAKDPTNRDHAVGAIQILNDAAIALSDARLDANTDATSSLYRTGNPSLDLQSTQGWVEFSGVNLLDATLLERQEAQTVPVGAVTIYGLPDPPDPGVVAIRPGLTSPPLPDIGQAPEVFVSLDRLNALFQEQAIAQLGANSPFTQAGAAAAPTVSDAFLLRPPLAAPSLAQAEQNAVALTSNLEQQAPSDALREWQQRTLEATAQSLGLSPNLGKLRSIPDLQQRLAQASSLSPALNAKLGAYVPAILNLQREDQPPGTTRITAILLTANGEPISRSLELPRASLDGWIRSLQRQLSRRAPFRPEAAQDPSQHLARALIHPLLPVLRERRVTALLVEVDRGLQAIPFGALPVEGRPLAEALALTITPSLGLIDLDPKRLAQAAPQAKMLLAGASAFSNGLEPLPMVRQELQALAAEHPSTLLLDGAFTPAALKQSALAPGVRQLHIATHANFLPGQASNGLLYTPTTSLSLSELGRGLRSRSSASPLGLISLSGCVTALGDEQSELGFVGMALQAGALSGLGTLWEVDDAATAAFFIQFYRHLKQGLPKDQALQATQRAFLRREVRLQGDRLVGPDPTAANSRSPLVRDLSREQQTLFAQGLEHPYYWAGMVLSGSPW